MPSRSEVGSHAAMHDRPIPSIEHDTTYPQQEPYPMPVATHERDAWRQMRRIQSAKPEIEREVVDLTTPEPESPRRYRPRANDTTPYDPRQPLLEMGRRVPQPQHGAPAPVQPYRR